MVIAAGIMAADIAIDYDYLQSNNEELKKRLLEYDFILFESFAWGFSRSVLDSMLGGDLRIVEQELLEVGVGFIQALANFADNIIEGNDAQSALKLDMIIMLSTPIITFVLTNCKAGPVAKVIKGFPVPLRSQLVRAGKRIAQADLNIEFLGKTVDVMGTAVREWFTGRIRKTLDV